MRQLGTYGALLLAWLPLVGCQSFPASPPEIPQAVAERDHSLTLIVARLQMHLRDDTYRMPRFGAEKGGDVFEASLWRLDRLHSAPVGVGGDEGWSNADVVIEYARARALERSRRYSAAENAYANVAAHGSLLAEAAHEAGEVMHRFAEYSEPPAELPASADDEIAWLDQRVEAWERMAWDLRKTSYEPLALEESEAWTMARVESLLRHRGVDQAIDASRRLVEGHRSSKRYASHLIRLGDLYAEAARHEYLRHRTDRRGLDTARYDAFLDRAFAAYELAGEQRRPALRAEAHEKIEALLAVHQGRAHVR